MNLYQDDIPSATVDKAQDNVHMVPIEQTNATGTYLYDLNEDCLLEIFSCNSLTPMDLCSLAETCPRFKPITQRVYRRSELGISYSYRGYKFNRDYYKKSRDVEKIMENFGPLLSTISLDSNKFFLNWIAKNCSDIPFKCLEIKCLEVVEGIGRFDSIVVQLKSTFERLCRFSCDSLTELRISYSSVCRVFMRSKFPNLKKFSYATTYFSQLDVRSEYNFSETDILINFIECHKRLTTLDLRGFASALCDYQLIKTIGKSCKELQELTLLHLSCHKPEDSSFDYSDMTKLRKLKVLETDFGVRNYVHKIALLQASTSLERLKLYFIADLSNIRQIFDELSQLQDLSELFIQYLHVDSVALLVKLTQVRKLNIRYTQGKFGANDFFSIIGSMTNLEEFAFNHKFFVLSKEEFFVLSKEEFYEIVGITERRKHVLNLICQFDSQLIENCVYGNVRLIKP